MNTHYTYFLILVASLAGPLALSFDKKVAFYRQWKYLFPAILIPAIFYIVWDVYFTSRGVWSFNQDYVSGIKIINLPVEEVLFFFVVPYCCMFIYECIRCYFPKTRGSINADYILMAIGLVLIVAGVIHIDQRYTAYTFILCASFIAALYIFKRFFKDFDALSFLVSYAIILVPFLLVNGFLTAIPVVIYNDEENLGVRIYSIPFEDMFYGMLLVMMTVAIFEKLRSAEVSRRLTAHPKTSK